MARLGRFDPTAARRLGVTLVFATGGGAALAALGAPAGWLMGAMVATAAAAILGAEIGLPSGLRDLAFLLLGISIGSGATPEGLGQIAAWPASVALLALSVTATLFAGAAYLERVHGWDRTTARFASMPGAFSAVVVMAANSAADMPRVVLAQSLRIFTLVLLMPPLISLLAPGTPTAAQASSVMNSSVTNSPMTNRPGETLLVFAAACLFAGLLRALRVPAGILLGAMLASVALHASGIVQGRFPPPLVIAGFVATGAVIGARFRGANLALLARTAPGALVSILIALAISAGFAFAGAQLLGMPFGKTWLAYAPGGVEAMAAMALALRLDPAFVGAHHVLRILGLNVAGPFWLGRAPRRKG